MAPIPNPGDFNLQNGYAPPEAASLVISPTMHSGWADLRNSVTKHVPAQLATSDTAVRAAYRVLAHRTRRGR